MNTSSTSLLRNLSFSVALLLYFCAAHQYFGQVRRIRQAAADWVSDYGLEWLTFLLTSRTLMTRQGCVDYQGRHDLFAKRSSRSGGRRKDVRSGRVREWKRRSTAEREI